jgi:nitrous oxide reductase
MHQHKDTFGRRAFLKAGALAAAATTVRAEDAAPAKAAPKHITTAKTMP